MFNTCTRSLAIRPKLFPQHHIAKQQKRNVEVSVVGAGSTIGANLALQLKQNSKVTKLKLHDIEPSVRGIAKELHQLPGGPAVGGFVGDEELHAAISSSKLILMVVNTARPPGVPKNEMLPISAARVQKLCRAMSKRNPDALLAISTTPINGMIPFASAILYKYQIFNPFKLFGITHIDYSRTRSYVATVLGANPGHLSVPVIGGHSEDTIVPLLSNLKPDLYSIDEQDAGMLTQMVKKAGGDILNSRTGKDPSLAMCWSIYEFADKLIDALYGHEVEVHAYTANPHFGTRFFSGPTTVGPYGIVRTCSGFPMSNLECQLLSDAVPCLHRDILRGENLSRRYNSD